MRYEVTIGIPVYNTEKYISRALDSALAQSFPDIEFLVCDDCGSDSSMDIVREYQHNHPRGKHIRIVRQPHNMGLGNARNRILDETKSQYLYHMDSDDYISPQTIELLYNAARKYDAQIVYGSHERIETTENGAKQQLFLYPFKVFQKENEFANYVYRKYEGIQAMTWNFLIETDVYRRNGLRHQPVNFWEDFSFTIDLPTYITRAVLLPEITYHYCCRSGSVTNPLFRRHLEKSEIMDTVNAVNQLKEKGDRIREKDYYPRRMYKLMMTDFYMVCSILQNNRLIDPPFANKEIKHILKSPLTLREIYRFRKARLQNLGLYLISVLPSWLAVAITKWIGKRFGLIDI